MVKAVYRVLFAATVAGGLNRQQTKVEDDARLQILPTLLGILAYTSLLFPIHTH